jgi:hypothetical protein
VQYYGSEIVSNVCFEVYASRLMFVHWTMSETKHKKLSCICRLTIGFLYISSMSILVLLTNMFMNIVEP